MRQATRAQWIKCATAILGTQLVGADCRSFHLRYLYHQENTLVILEEIEESYRS